MTNEVTIKTFEEIYAEFQSRLTSYGSKITNFGGGGAYDLLIRISSLMLSDAYQSLNDSLNIGFVTGAFGSWLDLKAQEVGLARKVASKCTKRLFLTRNSAATNLQIPVGDICKTPILPSVGSLRWFTIRNDALYGPTLKTGTTTDASPFRLIDSGGGLDTIPAGSIVSDSNNRFTYIVSIVSEFEAIVAEDFFQDVEGYTIRTAIAAELKVGELTGFVTVEADEAGIAYNNFESLLTIPPHPVTMEVVSGFSGIDYFTSIGEDLVAGTETETDPELRERIIARWEEITRGATRTAYENFAKDSSPAVFDANVTDERRGGPTGVVIIISGPPGSRSLLSSLGENSSADNFNPKYTSDGTPAGDPRPFGDDVHNYIRERAPLTDLIYLDSVTLKTFTLNCQIKILSGFVFATVQAAVKNRVLSFFAPVGGVVGVELLEVGETLHFSRLTNIIQETDGVDYVTFTTPAPGVDTTCLQTQVLIASLGNLIVTEIP